MPAPHPNSDGTTGETTSHLTGPAKDAEQVIGYSHSTKPASGQVAGYPPQAGEGTSDRCANLPLFLADENATLALAQRLAALLKHGMVIYLRGDLGAGKTTFVRGVLKALGHDGRVKSPTYTLVETYHAAGLSLLHFDLYRMHDCEEWESAGFRDEFDGLNVFFIEWPEKAQGLAPPADLEICISILAHGRSVEIHANTETGKQCIMLLKE